MSKIAKYITAFSFVIILLSIAVFSENSVHTPLASLVNNAYNINCSNQSFDSSLLFDQNRNTKLNITEKTNFVFKGNSSISSLYIIWDTVPTAWKITTNNGQVLQSTGNGFLHELVSFSSETSEFTLTVENARLCDIYLYTDGTLPDTVQVWQPPYTDADMLLVPTHADDEHLFFGGTMPYYSADKKIQVAYLTNHWAEPYRPHELLDGLWAVGITAYPVIPDFRDFYADNIDTARQLYPEEAVIEYQVELLRRFKPEVVIGHDVNGEYGHGAHILNTYCLQQAILLANDHTQYANSFKKYGVWDTKKIYLHLLKENEIIMDWDKPLPHFGNKTSLEMAVLGFSKHISQQEYFTVEAFGKYDCRKFGLYRTTVGADTFKNDFFENIATTNYSDYIVPDPSPSPTKPPLPISSTTLLTNENTNIASPFLGIGLVIISVLVLAILVIFITKKNKY